MRSAPTVGRGSAGPGKQVLIRRQLFLRGTCAVNLTEPDAARRRSILLAMELQRSRLRAHDLSPVRSWYGDRTRGGIADTCENAFWSRHSPSG